MALSKLMETYGNDMACVVEQWDGINGVGFEIEKIMSKRRELYLVRWQYYTSHFDTWSPRCDLGQHADQLIACFESQNKKATTTISQWFTQNGLWSRLAVPGDGACAFSAAWLGLHQTLKGEQMVQRIGIETRSTLIVQCAQQALVLVQQSPEAQQDKCTFINVSQILQKNPESLVPLWDNVPQTYLWLALVNQVLPGIQLEIWQWNKVEHIVYCAHHFGQGQVKVALFYTGDHYDLMCSQK